MPRNEESNDLSSELISLSETQSVEKEVAKKLVSQFVSPSEIQPSDKKSASVNSAAVGDLVDIAFGFASALLGGATKKTSKNITQSDTTLTGATLTDKASVDQKPLDSASLKQAIADLRQAIPNITDKRQLCWADYVVRNLLIATENATGIKSRYSLPSLDLNGADGKLAAFRDMEVVPEIKAFNELIKNPNEMESFINLLKQSASTQSDVFMFLGMATEMFACLQEQTRNVFEIKHPNAAVWFGLRQTSETYSVPSAFWQNPITNQAEHAGLGGQVGRPRTR